MHVVVLGNKLKDNKMSAELKNRLDACLAYIRDHDVDGVIVSGGICAPNTITESSLMKQYLLDKGIDVPIIEEDQSVDTITNIINVSKMCDSAYIITSDYHLKRVLKIAEKVGLKCSGMGVKTPLYERPWHLICEYVGYRQLKKTSL